MAQHIVAYLGASDSALLLTLCALQITNIIIIIIIITIINYIALYRIIYSFALLSIQFI